MSLLKPLCLIGLHPRTGWAFVGDSWNPDIYIRVCDECGTQVYDKEGEE